MPRFIGLGLSAVACAGFIILSSEATEASRPKLKKPPGCTTYFHGPTGKARSSQSKAKKRARRRWRDRVTVKHGLKYRKWDLAGDKHYDCTKKGKWHHCQAAAYPCWIHEAGAKYD